VTFRKKSKIQFFLAFHWFLTGPFQFEALHAGLRINLSTAQRSTGVKILVSHRRFLEHVYTGLVRTEHGIDIDLTSAADQIKQRHNAASGIARHEQHTESDKQYA
jgi:hypothetical protein